jgi:hypothetical protein
LKCSSGSAPSGANTIKPEAEQVLAGDIIATG